MKLSYIALAAVVLAVSACSPTMKEPGTYKKTERSVNASGTETERTTRTHVYDDADGNRRATEKTETSRDPKGLFNKSTSTTTRTYN